MFRTTVISILLLFNIKVGQHVSDATQPLEEFFPFGIEVGDTIIPHGDDNSYGPIALPYTFPYFDNNHRQIYQANNGLFSFLGPIDTYVPLPFPLGNDQRLITPFWSDIDTRGTTRNVSDNSVYNHIYIRTSINSSNATATVFAKAALFVRQYFPGEMVFDPVMIITGTWYRVGYYDRYTDRLNTFQMVLATDESRSFAFFLYNDLQWASPKSGDPYAQAGFNAGDGITAKMLKYSRTSNITLLTNESNVYVPGFFIFRIDTTNIEPAGCSESDPLIHRPVRGRQIGGVVVSFQGPCFNTNTTEFLCRFGEFGTVPGLVLSEFQATCVSPLAAYAGNVDLSVSFDEGETFNSSGSFTYMPMTDDISASEEIILRQNGTDTQLVSWNDTIELEWIFSGASLAGLTSDTLIDIEYAVLKPDEESTHQRKQASNTDVDIKIDSTITLASGIRPQIGRQTIEINLPEIAQNQTDIRIVPFAGIAIGIFRIGWYVYNTKPVKIYRFVKIAMKIVNKAAEFGCDAWSDSQPDPSTWNQHILPCPNTYRQAQVATGEYKPDTMCKDGWLIPTVIPIIGNCWFHQGRPQFNEDSAAACYRSKAYNSEGAGGQCCYNKAGQIITRGTGAGSDDRYHSDKTFWKHQFHDMITFLACCKLQSDPERCDKYLQHRPPRSGSDTMGQFGGTWGDPHFLTPDGTSYTFNGYGEYTYLAISSQQSVVFNTSIPFQFESQIRTTPLGAGVNNVTAIKAFAARVNSLTLSITVTRRQLLLVHVNDVELTFERDLDSFTQFDTITQRFEDFIITKNLSTNQFTLSWTMGISVQITPVFVNTTSILVLNVATAISGELKGNWTLGLIGAYDDDPNNDIRDNFGTVVGTVDTLSSRQIHELFGMVWAIDPSRSLFYYESGDNASFYSTQNKNYRPSFLEPTAGPLDLMAREICGISLNSTNSSQWSPVQRTCYYDISVTKDLAFGYLSRQAAEQQIEQREAIRNPPKFNSGLSLTQTVKIDQQVSISFQATSEFSSIIAYKLLRGPTEASVDGVTGQFEWKVPEETVVGSKTPIQVSAQDSTYNLTSAYEVLLEVEPKSATSHTFTTSTFLLVLSLVSSTIFE